MALASEAKNHDDEVLITFIGAGTRWPKVLSEIGHPFNELYDSVRDLVKGASCGCAQAFGASEDLKACGIEELKETEVAGAQVFSVRNLIQEGYHVQIF